MSKFKTSTSSVHVHVGAFKLLQASCFYFLYCLLIFTTSVGDTSVQSYCTFSRSFHAYNFGKPLSIKCTNKIIGMNQVGKCAIMYHCCISVINNNSSALCTPNGKWFEHSYVKMLQFKPKGSRTLYCQHHACASHQIILTHEAMVWCNIKHWK